MSCWQPIETAPKDGTQILLFDPSGTWDPDLASFSPRVAVGAWKDFPNGHGEWRGYYSGLSAVEEPTHWMPLPEPPKS